MVTVADVQWVTITGTNSRCVLAELRLHWQLEQRAAIASRYDQFSELGRRTIVSHQVLATILYPRKRSVLRRA